MHRFFVDFAHVSGAGIYYESDPSVRFLFTINMYLELMWKSMTEVEQGDDPYLRAQACYFAYVALTQVEDRFHGKCYLRKAISIVHRHRISFLDNEDTPTLLGPFQYSEEAHERSALLARLVHAEAALQITTGEVWDTTSDLEQQFRSELPVSANKNCGSLLQLLIC